MAAGGDRTLAIKIEGRDGFTPIARRVSRELQGTQRSARLFADQMSRTSAAISFIDGPLGGIASRVSAVGTLLRGGGLAATGFGLAIAGAGAILGRGIAEMNRYEVAMGRVDAILEATSHRAGVTSQEIAKLSREIADATLMGDQDILNIAPRFLARRNIFGEQLERGMRAAADLRAVRGGSLQESAGIIIPALNNPETAAQRMGSYMNVAGLKAQQAELERLIAIGKTWEAQQIVLDELNRAFQGAAAGEAQGLAGSIDTIGTSIVRFGHHVAEASGVAEVFRQYLAGLGEFAKRAADGAEEWNRSQGRTATFTDLLHLDEAELRQRLEEIARESDEVFHDVFGKALEQSQLMQNTPGMPWGDLQGGVLDGHVAQLERIVEIWKEVDVAMIPIRQHQGDYAAFTKARTQAEEVALAIERTFKGAQERYDALTIDPLIKQLQDAEKAAEVARASMDALMDEHRVSPLAVTPEQWEMAVKNHDLHVATLNIIKEQVAERSAGGIIGALEEEIRIQSELNASVGQGVEAYKDAELWAKARTRAETELAKAIGDVSEEDRKAAEMAAYNLLKSQQMHQEEVAAINATATANKRVSDQIGDLRFQIDMQRQIIGAYDESASAAARLTEQMKLQDQIRKATKGATSGTGELSSLMTQLHELEQAVKARELTAELDAQVSAHERVINAYRVSVQAGEQMRQQMDLEAEILTKTKGLTDEKAAAIEALIIRQRELAQSETEAATFAAGGENLDEQAERARRMIQAYGLGSEAVADLNRELEKEAWLRQFTDGLTGDMLTKRREEADAVWNLLELERERQKEFQTTKQIAEEMGSALTGAFQDAVWRGEELDQVLWNLYQRISDIAFQSFAEPFLKNTFTNLSESLMQGMNMGGGGESGASGGGGGTSLLADIGNFFGTMFAGGREHGGPVQAGRAYVVGERRPELFIPHTSGNIVPNTTAISSRSQAPNISFNFNGMKPSSADRRSMNQIGAKAYEAMIAGQRYR